MLSKTAEYALRATVWLAREPGKSEPAEQLANSIRVPRRYLHKVLQDLVAAGLVHSRPGPGGGYSLEREPDEITILDVVNAVDPIQRIRGCPLGLSTHTSLCPLHQALDQSYAAVEESLGKVTLADVLRQPDRVPPLVEITKAKAKAKKKTSRGKSGC